MSRIDRLYWDEAWTDEIVVARQKKQRQSTKGKKPSPRWDPFFSNCEHWRQPFELEDGLRVFASSWVDHPKDGIERGAFAGSPDVGLYLDTRWASDQLLVTPGTVAPFTRRRSSPNTVVLFPWPDYGVPSDRRSLVKVLRWVLTLAAKGQTLEIGCMGGHGRTGTALAALLVLQGLTGEAAIRRVRRRYCDEAIESRPQLDFVRSILA